MAIEGNLTDMDVAEIIQLNCRSGEKARVSLEHGRGTGDIYFADGQVVHAAHEQDSGEEAVYRLLGWEEGRFVIERGIASPQETVHLPWSTLLLRGLKRFDEKFASSHQDQEAKEVYEEREKVNEVLQELADSLDGFAAASVIGAEGILASLVTDETFDDRKASTILSQLVKQASEASTAMNGGAFAESITTTKKYQFVTRPIGQGQYYVRVILTAGGNIGAARMYLTDTEEDLLDTLLTGDS